MKTPFLDKIESPRDLRQKIAQKDLPEVCHELRHEILNEISQVGGHLASNLGTIELTVALHYVFDTPQDKLIWDVGHQAYGHKVLTGRRAGLKSIRHKDGLSGFTSRSESEYDHFGAGHASTSISAAVGMATGMEKKGQDHFAIPIIGDGSLSGGLAFEALNNAGFLPSKNLLIIFNDNDISIDPNVGAMTQLLEQMRVHPGYHKLKSQLKKSLKEDTLLHQLFSWVKAQLKSLTQGPNLFESLGIQYFGPVDGHDVKSLVDTLQNIKAIGPQGPFLLHTITVKGKGYPPAEHKPVQYHGVGKFEVEDGIPASDKKPPSKYQDHFAQNLIKLAKEDENIIAITAAMPSGTGLTAFQKKFPTRFYDVGIAEAHAVLFAAGLASEGFTPVVAIYSTFLQRAFDQLIHDVALQKLPVVFALDRAGFVGADGATHQGLFDLSYLRTIPNFVIMAPQNENEFQHMMRTAIEYKKGPIAIRYPRGGGIGVPLEAEMRSLPIGKGIITYQSHPNQEQVDVTIIAIGQSVVTAQKIFHQLIREQPRLSHQIINARFLKPLDENLLISAIKKSRLVVTLEENNILGGFGSAISELRSLHHLTTPHLMFGVNDVFIEHATQEEQREFTHSDATSVSQKILKWFADTSHLPHSQNLLHQPQTNLTQEPSHLN